MDATDSLAVLRRVSFPGAIVSGLVGFARRHLGHTRLTTDAITTNLWAPGKDIQTEGEQMHMNALAIILYRHSE